MTSTTSFQVKIEFETGNTGAPYVTLNNISIGDLYTEDFTNQDGAGWDNDVYTPPPVDWTFVDTETPAPNYSSALDFDGINDYISFPADASLNISTANHSMSFWLKTTDSGICVVSQKSGTELAAWIQSSKIKWAAESPFSSTSNINDGTWKHICFVADGSSSYIYINGILDATGGSQIRSSASGSVFAIGSRPGSFPYEGLISNWALFSSALSALQVAALYNSGTPETAISFSPVSWWKLDNTTTGIQDSGSASNNGTNNGATQIATNVLISNNGESDTLPTSALTPSDLQFESPYSNYSLDFAGSQDIDCGNNSVFNNTFTGNAFSFSAWIKSSSNVAYDGILNFGSRVQSFLNSNKIKIWLQGSSGYIVTAFTSNTTILSDTWYHIVFTKNGDDNTLYINGVSDNTVTSTGNVASTTSNFRIGSYDGSQYFWDGNLDEVALWNTALTQTQVTQVYNNGYPGNLTSLSPISWWRLGEDAYFVSNVVTIPNQITSGPTGTGSGTQTAILVGEAPGSYANGSGVNLVVTDRIGDAPESTANSVSINMIPSNRISYPAGYTPTQVNNAFSMEFDGASDHILLDEINLGSTQTLSFWINRTANAVAECVLGGSNGWGNPGLAVYIETNNYIYFQVNGIGAGSKNFGNVFGTRPAGNWYHICISRNGDSTTLYVDGVSVRTITGFGTGDLKIDAIGAARWANASGYAYNFDGKIDEVALFDYTLSARQIKQDIYNGTTTGKTADLNNISNLTAPVAWYRMGD